ncbi:MAG: hypothetical protein J6Y94_04010 [Bacteriovoracaceae bacterium]|nr:hypothetical protein [Bacteriovoracaceae bacterium]
MGLNIFLFVLASTAFLAFFLRPSAEELSLQHRFDEKIMAALPLPRPPHLVLTLTAGWCGICHKQFREMQQRFISHDFSQGDYQWWALSIDSATEDHLKEWWIVENLTLKLLLGGRQIESLVKELPSLALPMHYLIEDNMGHQISYRELKALGKKVWEKTAKNN